MSLAGTALLGVQGVLGLAELAVGGTKLLGQEDQVETFERFGYPQWFRVATGGAELLAAVGLLAGLVLQPVYGLAGNLLALVVLTGALGSHARAGDPATQFVPAGVLFFLAAVVTWSRLGALA